MCSIIFVLGLCIMFIMIEYYFYKLCINAIEKL